jgi:hypothetical protein
MSLLNDHSEVLNLWYCKSTLLQLQVQVVVLESLENLLCSFVVFSLPSQEDEQIVHVNDEPPFSDEVAKKVVHERLERGGGVTKAEKHNSGFEEIEGSDECCFPVVLRSDQHVVVSPAYVYFSKNTQAPKTIDKVGDEGKRVRVFDGVGVYILVVLAGTYQPILLRDEEG